MSLWKIPNENLLWDVWDAGKSFTFFFFFGADKWKTINRGDLLNMIIFCVAVCLDILIPLSMPEYEEKKTGKEENSFTNYCFVTVRQFTFYWFGGKWVENDCWKLWIEKKEKKESWIAFLFLLGEKKNQAEMIKRRNIYVCSKKNFLYFYSSTFFFLLQNSCLVAASSGLLFFKIRSRFAKN